MKRATIRLACALAALACPALFHCTIGSPDQDEPEIVDDHEGAATATCPELAIAAATASSDDGNVAANVLDGKRSTRWSSYGVGSWIQLDLGTARKICEVAVAWYRGNQRQYSFDVSVSPDGTSFTSIFSGTSGGTTLAAETYDVSDATGRYVRITVRGNTDNDWASITEADVFGGDPDAVPEPTPTPEPTPIPDPGTNIDKFGIEKIYQTTSGGREYFMNMAATTLTGLQDGGRMARFNSSVTYDAAGRFWTVNGGSIRFVMTTPAGEQPWRNVEMTMEVRMRSGNLIQPYARGEQHTTDVTGAWHGSANKHRFWFDAPARAGYMKELYHHSQNHGYASPNQAVTNVGASSLDLRNKWVRIKTMVYNVSNNTQAKFETWVDLNLDNNWVKVTEYVDDGGWYVRDQAAMTSFLDYMLATYPTSVPRNRDTGQVLKTDEVITWAGDYVSWRSDNAVWDFKNLSCREIGGPPSAY
jgi:hypothetical protein